MVKKTPPKVKFKVASVKHVIPTINYFLNPKKGDWDWSRYILGKYPELEKQLKDVRKVFERKKIAEKFFKDYIVKNKNNAEKTTKRFQKEWNKINNEYMEILSEVLEIDWPIKEKVFRAFLSPNPICPRYIKQRIFDVSYDSTRERMIEVAMHEILHFLWFIKWKKLFPKTPEKNFDAPYLEWDLSEIVTKAVLSDKRIQEIHKHQPGVYREHQGMKIEGRFLLKHIGEIYYKKKSFEDFIEKSWAFVQKHKKVIQK